jgi:signal transduction histidine kinase
VTARPTIGTGLLLAVAALVLVPLALSLAVFALSWKVLLPVSELRVPVDLARFAEESAVLPLRAAFPGILAQDPGSAARFVQALRPLLDSSGGRLHVFDREGGALLSADGRGPGAVSGGAVSGGAANGGSALSQAAIEAFNPGFALVGFDEARYSWELFDQGEVGGYARFSFAPSRVAGGFKSVSGPFLLLAFGVGEAAFFLLLLVLARKLSGRFLAPLRELASVSRSIAEGDLEFKLDYRGDDEIGALFESLELMRMRLKASLIRQGEEEEERRRMIASVSHDLRTPVTSIKGYVEGLLDGVAEDRETRERYLRVIKDKTERLIRLIEDLFRMSQLDADESVLRLEELSATELLEDILGPLERDLLAARFSLAVKRPFPDCRLRADRRRLAQVVENVTQNAKRYLPEAGVVYVRAEIEGASLSLSISDNGPGHSGGGPSEGVRAVLSGGQGAIGGPRRGGARPRDLQEDRGAARREDPGREPAGLGRDHRLYPAHSPADRRPIGGLKGADEDW